VVQSGSDRAQLAPMAKATKAVLEVDELEVVADRGYFSSDQILQCSKIGVVPTLPAPQTSGNRIKGQFVKQDFRYLAERDVYICPAGEALTPRNWREEKGLKVRRYWTSVCRSCSLKAQCTTGTERRVTRWEHEHLLEELQERLDLNPQAMRQRRETVEHPFGTIKHRMGATHFLMKRLRNVRTEMALSVLAYNLTRVMNIIGIGALMAAMRA